MSRLSARERHELERRLPEPLTDVQRIRARFAEWQCNRRWREGVIVRRAIPATGLSEVAIVLSCADPVIAEHFMQRAEAWLKEVGPLLR